MITVLVIDQDPGFLRATAEYLSDGDTIRISAVRSVDEALEALKERKLDVIIANIGLRDKGGVALMDLLKEHGYEIPVVFYGHRVSENAIINAMRHGAEFVLQLSDEPKAQLLELRSLIEEIVHRRKTEDTLRQTVEDLRAIVTHNADAMIVLDQRGYIQFANPAAESLFNMPEPELIGKLFGFPIVLQEPVEMYIVREFKKFVAVEMRMVEVRWRGQQSYLLSMRDVTWHVQHEEELSQKKERLEAEAQDRSRDLMEAYQSLRSEVTERKRAELALRESERKYRQIVELAYEGIWVLDRNGFIRFANPKIAEMLGYGPEEMIGRSIYDFVDREFVPTQKYFIERKKQGIKESYDTELRRKDGTKLLAMANGAPILDEEGYFYGSVSMLTDITERKRIEEELKDAKAQSELYLDLMGHDIRNLAQIGMGYLELALESEDPGETKELISKPLGALEDMAQIIDNVRKLRDTQPGVVRSKTIDLCEILSRLQSQYSRDDKRSITITLETLPDCNAYANELVADVFTNLINNAIKHSYPERPLTISIKVDRIKEKEVDYLRCSVEDNGPGISNWIKDRIFVRFQRGDTKAHGKGLGLHIARTLVEGYGGKIWVEDRVPGDYTQGARFVVVLPAA